VSTIDVEVPVADGIHVEQWELPDWVAIAGERARACRSCGAPILWCVTLNDRNAPINADGTSHFATCPDADSWRRR
jgi:hypothetical protein